MKGHPGWLKMRWRELYEKENERKKRRHWNTKQSGKKVCCHMSNNVSSLRNKNGLKRKKCPLESKTYTREDIRKGKIRCGRPHFWQCQKEGKRRGVKKEGDEKNEDQTSCGLGSAVQKGSMWTSVRGSTGGLTSRLHYKRKALWGSDPMGACEGVAVIPARNKWNNTSGDWAQAARSMPGSRLRAPLKSKELYSHIACLMSSPSLAWMKCSLYFGSARARLQKNSHRHAHCRTIWWLFSQ